MRWNYNNKKPSNIGIKVPDMEWETTQATTP